jgi:hypothetical protein
MKIAPYVEKLHNSPTYREFEQKHKDAFLIAGFFVLDFEAGKHLHQIDYYVPSKKKVAAFTLDNKIVLQLLDMMDHKVPEHLDIKTNIDLDALKGIILDEMKNRGITQDIKKMIAVVQSIAVFLDNLKLKMPIIGPVLTKIDSAKFCQFFAMTFKSGLGVLECLDSSAGVIKNKAIKVSIAGAKQRVSDGQKLAQAIATTGYFPTMVSRMFKIGEESGNMESALNNIKFFYDREINDSIDRIVGMIQPSITLVMGGMITWIEKK